MANPFFHFEDFFAKTSLVGHTVSMTSEAGGFPKENLADWRRWNKWKATSTADQIYKVDLGSGNDLEADTIVIAGHNGGTVSGEWRVRYSDDDIAYTNVTGMGYTAFADDDPIVVIASASAGAHRYWRVDLGNSPSAVMSCGIITLGRRLELPRLSPDISPYNELIKADWAMNENGQFLGANYRFQRRTGIDLRYKTGFPKTVFWQPVSGIGFDADFAPHLRIPKPFWFTWNITEEPRHVWQCRAIRWSAPFVQTINRRSLTMDLEDAH